MYGDKMQFCLQVFNLTSAACYGISLEYHPSLLEEKNTGAEITAEDIPQFFSDGDEEEIPLGLTKPHNANIFTNKKILKSISILLICQAL